MDAPYARFEALVRAGAWTRSGEPELVTSYSNDAWYVRSASAGEVVLRVCWIGDRERLLREAAVGRALPAAVGYPGGARVRRPDRRRRADHLDDQPPAVRHDPAEGLAGRCGRAAARPGPARRRGAAAQPCTPGVPRRTWRRASVRRRRARIRRPSSARPSCRCRWIGYASWSPRPATRPPSTGPSIAEAWSWLIDHADLLPRLDDPADAVTHGDLHLDNIWWDGERVTGLLDLEWVRWGPALDRSGVGPGQRPGRRRVQ